MLKWKSGGPGGLLGNIQICLGNVFYVFGVFDHFWGFPGDVFIILLSSGGATDVFS